MKYKIKPIWIKFASCVLNEKYNEFVEAESVEEAMDRISKPGLGIGFSVEDENGVSCGSTLLIPLGVNDKCMTWNELNNLISGDIESNKESL